MNDTRSHSPWRTLLHCACFHGRLCHLLLLFSAVALLLGVLVAFRLVRLKQLWEKIIHNPRPILLHFMQQPLLWLFYLGKFSLPSEQFSSFWVTLIAKRNLYIKEIIRYKRFLVRRKETQPIFVSPRKFECCLSPDFSGTRSRTFQNSMMEARTFHKRTLWWGRKFQEETSFSAKHLSHTTLNREQNSRPRVDQTNFWHCLRHRNENLKIMNCWVLFRTPT